MDTKKFVVRSAIVKPQVKATVIPVPLSRQRLALHRGPFKAERDLMIIDDPRGLIGAALGKMNGTRTFAALADSMNADGFAVSEREVQEIVEMLAEKGVVADASSLSNDKLGREDAVRYSRNLHCWSSINYDGREGVDIQGKLGDSHVAVLGVGGIGTAVAISLAMAGVGKLTLVDFDRVELSNLNRQLLFTVDDLGKEKADVAKRAIGRVNPDVAVRTIIAKMENSKQVRDLIKATRPDFVANAVDRPTVAIDRWVNEACFAEGIPFSANSVSGNTAIFWTKIPGQTGCYNCDDLWSEMRSPDHFELKNYREARDLIAATSALSFTAMTIGALTASEITRFLVDWPIASAGRSILVDFSTLRMTESDRPVHPDCPICGGNGRKVDVRRSA